VTYHPNGAIKQFTYGNGIVHTLTQNARGLPDTSCDYYGTCNASAVLNDGYDYDGNANVAAISDGRTGNRGNRTMTYDALDRLTGTVSPMFGTATYTYDVLDNLTRVQVGATSNLAARDHHYCYDTAWRLTNVKTSSCTTGATVAGLGYDVQGNLANKNGLAYTFDYGNRLRLVMQGGTWVESYRYDAHGRRVRSFHSGGVLRSVYGQDGALRFQRNERTGKDVDHILLNGSLVATREVPTAGGAAVVKYQHTDALGSPVAITDASRAVVERSEYEPYGGVGNRAARDGVGYTGHVEDAATSLTYMQQRYYDPQIGLFLSVDPVTAYSNPVGQFHRYRYANNNPYKFVDPDGRQSCNGTTCHLTDVNQLPGYAVIVTATAVSDFINTIFPIIPLAAQVSRSQSSNADDAPGPDGGSKPGDAFPDRPLPRGSGGEPAPDPEANGPHTQLGRKEGRNGSYPQAREFDGNGKPVRDVDFTDHGRPGNHTNPHEHPYIDNPTGGTPQRGPSRPLPENERPAR
jgi:RHS repeat-associated protein